MRNDYLNSFLPFHDLKVLLYIMLDLSKTHIHISHPHKQINNFLWIVPVILYFVNFFSFAFLFSIKIATLYLNQTKESNKREGAV